MYTGVLIDRHHERSMRFHKRAYSRVRMRYPSHFG